MATLEFEITCAGSAGSAAGSVASTTKYDTFNGTLMAVRLEYSGAPATTVVTITETAGMKRTLFTSPATATPGTYHPLTAAHDTAGAAIDGQYVYQHLEHGFTIAVSNSDPDAVITARLQVM